LAEPVALGDAAFYLSPCAGIAILGEDALKPTALLEHARVALAEARRSGAGSVQFYSDTLRMRVGIRLDFEHELRKAIADDQIGINYVGRHNLDSGRLVAVQAYLCWRHPMRGEVSPAEFLPIAASTGLAMAISQCALARLRGDVDAWRQALGTTVKLSFGPLRHHLVSEDFLPDIERLFQSSGLGPGMIEIRIAEKTLTSLGKAERLLSRLAGLGATIAIDEFGRGTSSLARIAALPVHALQIDRRFVLALGEPPALRFCKGAIALARSYGLTPIAPGVDSEAARRALQGLGCEQGLGDCFSPLALPVAGSQFNRRVV
jgi:EAL domain-containing protein (putative c-di-GMP-specific phosphodiesterase class I)